MYDDSLYLFRPTVGVAWDPSGDGKSSIRANYRIASYDRTNTFLSSFIFQSAPGLTRGDEQHVRTERRSAALGVPMLNSKRRSRRSNFRQPPAFSTNSLNVVDPELQYPRIHQYSVSYQREIGWKNVLEVNYIGARGRNLFTAATTSIR